MDRRFGEYRYYSRPVQDRQEGFSSIELSCERQGHSERVARVVLWDACGQFYVETFETDVPVDIIEELIAEAKAEIKTS